MHQALYRKWRPKSFEDVVGQEHITGTLQRQIVEGHLSHAYLFTGTRGTGKTTCAKILSKAVNCEHPINGDPCNRCEACKGIDNGSLLDVLELDAASNNGVDHVRALRDDAIYAPAKVRYRVYIIDEVHMLSVAAFNALLKILEEPPAHLIFILATTELHKVPATILSRCQRFSFKRILPTDIASRLLTVARAEEIPLTESGAEILARLADGALRDGLSLLDQCAASGGIVDENKVYEVLGLAGTLQTAELFTYLLNRQAEEALLLFDTLYRNGKDTAALLGELSTLSRDLLIMMTAPRGGSALLSGSYDGETLSRLAAMAKPQRMLHLTALLQDTAAGLSLSVHRRTDMELCLLKMCDDSLCGDITALAARMERLESGVVTPPPAKAVPKQASSKAAPRQEAAPAVLQKAEEKPVEEIPWEEPPLPEEPPAMTAAPITELPAEREKPQTAQEKFAPVAESSPIWLQMFDYYKARLLPMYRAFLDDAYGVMKDDVLTVYCGSELTMQKLSCERVTAVLQDVTATAVGTPVRIVFSLGGKKAESIQTQPVNTEDNLNALLEAGKELEHFTVK